jgi:hypothetical protein
MTDADQSAARLQALIDAHAGWEVDAAMREILKDRTRLMSENKRLREQIQFGVWTDEEWQHTEPALVAGMVGLGERYGTQKIARIAAYLATHPTTESKPGGDDG